MDFSGFSPVRFRDQIIEGYLIDKSGRVWSEKSWKFLKPYPAGNYLRVDLRFKGQTLKTLIHWLMAETFIGPRPENFDVCHRNNDGTANQLDNLRYDTRSGNLADREEHGTDQCGERNPHAFLTDQEAEEIKLRRASGESLRSLSAAFGVAESTVSRIANNVRRSR